MKERLHADHVAKGRRVWTYRCPSLETYRRLVGDTSQEHPGGTWGAYIEGMPKRTGLTMRKLAELAGVARSTLYKWINGTTGVTVDSVIRIAKAAGDPTSIALRAAGGRLIDETDDPQLADIYASDLPDNVKQELVDFVLDQRHRDAEALRQQVGVMIRAHGRAAG